MFGKVGSAGDYPGSAILSKVARGEGFWGVGGVMHQISRFALGAMSSLGLLLLPVAAMAEEAAGKPAGTAAAPADAASKPADAVSKATAAAPAGTAWNAEVAPADSAGGMTLDVRQTELVNKVSGYFK